MENNVNNSYEPQPRFSGQSNGPKNNNSIVAGFLIVLLGVFVFFRNTDMLQGSVFDFIFSIPMLLIIGGLIIGYKNDFRSKEWIVLLIIGVLLLLRKLHINVGQFVLPVILVGIGLNIILKNRNKDQLQRDMQESGNATDSDYINMDALFSGTETFVQTQNFKGGVISAIMGSVKIDCKQASLEEDAVLNISVFCGGVELIVPANWIVVNDCTTILGGMEDRRQMINLTGYEKRLILKGSVVCGGVDIKSF